MPPPVEEEVFPLLEALVSLVALVADAPPAPVLPNRSPTEWEPHPRKTGAPRSKERSFFMGERIIACLSGGSPGPIHRRGCAHIGDRAPPRWNGEGWALKSREDIDLGGAHYR